MNHDQNVRDDIQRVLLERRQEGIVAMMALYGGQEGWFAECRARKAADPDYKMSRAILRLLRRAGDAGPLAGRVSDRECLATDPTLNAFWRSVAAAGPDGWREEKRRLKEVEQDAIGSSDPNERLMALDVNAVKGLLPLYRAWGRMLIEADASTPSEVAIRP